jgi:hypothetical protein
MAQATITVTTTAGATRILLTSSIKRIRTEGTGTQIFFGSPQGGGKSPRSVSVTQSLATVVTALDNAIIPLTVITNGVGTVNYFPTTAIKDVRANVASPINATIAIGSAGGAGEIVDNFNVSETAAAVATLLNNAGGGAGGGVTSLQFGAGAVQTGAVTLPIDDAVDASALPTLVSKDKLLEINDNLLYQKAMHAPLNWSNDVVDSLGRPVAYSAYLYNVGTPKANKSINLATTLLATTYYFEVIEIFFNTVVTTLTLTSTGYPMLIDAAVLGAASDTVTISTCKSIRLQYAPLYTGGPRILVIKTS